MQVTVSFRIPRELRDRMKALSICWSEVVREAIEREVARRERRDAVRAFLKLAEEAPKVPPGTVVRALRQTRGEA